jgi:hypothetical protein
VALRAHDAQEAVREAGTAKLLLIYGVLFSAGLVVPAR